MIKDTFIYFLSKFLPSLISFVILLIYLSKMTPTNYGFFSVLIVSFGLIGIFTSQWIRSSMVRYYYEINNVMGITVILQVIVAIIICFLIAFAKFIFNFDLKIALISTMIILNILINELYNNYYRIVLKPNVVLWGNVIKNTFYVIFLIIVLAADKTNVLFEQALIAFLIGLLVSNLYYILSTSYKQFEIRLESSAIKKFLKYGMPLTISFSLGVLLQNIDKYMITYILGVKSNGNYSIVFDFIHNYLYMIMGAIGLASLPRILKNKNKVNIDSEFSKYVKLFHLICIPILFIFVIFTPELTYVINMFDYETNVYILILIGIATYFHGINSYIYGQAYQLKESTKNILLPSFIAILVNILVNLLLLEKYGVIISAISTLLAFIVSNFMLSLNIKLKSQKLNHKKHMLLIFSIILTSCLLMVPIISIWINLVFKIIVLLIIISVIFWNKRKILKGEIL